MIRRYKFAIAVLAVCFIVLWSGSNAQADTVVGFNVGGAGGNLGPAYVENGFTFASTTVGIQANQLHVSTPNILAPIVITFEGGAFDFVSFDYVFAGGLSGTTFTASNGATFTPLFPGVTYTLGPEFQNITSLTVTHFVTVPPEGFTFNVYDNFTFRTNQVASVPEPSTIVMLAMGLSGVCQAVRKRRVPPNSQP